MLQLGIAEQPGTGAQAIKEKKQTGKFAKTPAKPNLKDAKYVVLVAWLPLVQALPDKGIPYQKK